MEPSTCPESISDNPKSISDNPKSALGWLSQFAYFLRFHFQTFFEKVDLPQPLWNFVQEQKVTSGDPLLISFFKKVRTRKLISQDSFEFFDFSSSFLQNFTKTLFFILSLLGVILQRLCSRQVLHVGSIQVAYILGFPTFVRRRRKNSPNLSSPSPTCAGIKYPVRGNPSL